MTYSAVYCALIEKRMQNPISKNDCYCERHHIIPKSEGGSDDADNLVNLTAREHYIAHLLLAKIYKDMKMYSAITYFHTCSQNLPERKHIRFNSKLYQLMRLRYSTAKKGQTVQSEVKKQISRTVKELWEDADYRQKVYDARMKAIHTDEYFKTSSDIARSQWESSDYRNKQKQSHREYFERRRRLNPEPVVQYSLEGELLKEYDSIFSASSECGIGVKFIRRCCRGERNSCYGFKWRYAEVNSNAEKN